MLMRGRKRPMSRLAMSQGRAMAASLPWITPAYCRTGGATGVPEKDEVSATGMARRSL